MISKLQINTLVNISFFAVIGLVTIFLIASQIELSKIETDSIRVTSLRAPTVKASASMNTAINSSLAALRGWMLLEEERFLVHRRNAWQIIREEEKILLILSLKWTNPDNKSRFSDITTLLSQLENEQSKIELLAHRPENIHSVNILFSTAVPLATLIADNITKLIDYSKTQKATTERLALLAAMADFRGSFALSIADIRAFLLSADANFQNSFKANWDKNTQSYERLASLTDRLGTFEQNLLSKIKILMDKFQPLPEEMFNSRNSKEWNKANYLLKNTAAKTANNLIETLNDMVSDQNNLLEQDAKLISRNVEYIKIFQIGFLGFCLLLVFYFNRAINSKYRLFRQDLNKRDSIIDQNIMMATLDKAGTIIDISNSLCRKLGGTKQSLIGTESNFFLTQDNDSQLDMILNALLTGETWQGELMQKSISNEEVWLSSTIIPINSPGEGEV